MNPYRLPAPSPKPISEKPAKPAETWAQMCARYRSQTPLFLFMAFFYTAGSCLRYCI